MNNQLDDLCKSLHLTHVARQVNEIKDESKEAFIISLLQHEVNCRETVKIERFQKSAKFPSQKSLDQYEWHQHIKLPTAETRSELESCAFIPRAENVVLVGSPGTGKTHLAIGIGRKACEIGYETRFLRVSDLVIELEKHWRNHTLELFKKRFDKVKCIILDEMGYVPFTKDGSELLFQLISDWYETKSVIITSNLEFSQWNRVFVDPRLTAALVDRLIHHAHILSFTGESYRLKNALSNTSK
ncbi:DNA replication protein DnaC [Carnobacterium iners]|uniref:DNA replication protein DnaC n=1 Tax=Carnobacterium iners TaxID=1073423 RepID=A0A1X7N4Y4_9LACT|nr:IS21-like element helper ATPase IstB [Carnobacterium iners]SEK62030.1 DNA replication protein DnaC [Carnobacterium iners]SMH31900.1 DNA replication protein DnaC [Carnobacterium iners]